jgi:hypothetical protein
MDFSKRRNLMPGSKLSLIRARQSEPPKPLAEAGMALWTRVTNAYVIADEGGKELLWQICKAEDRLTELAAEIASDGVILRSRTGSKEHPGLKLELGLRSFVVRSLGRLGLDVEPVRGPGNPGSGGCGVTDWDR